MTSELRECIDDCMDCHRVCVETISHCLQKGGRHTEPAHLRLMLDCEQICRAAGDFLLRNSEFHPRICGVCADVCVRCADDCDDLAEGDVQMRLCAETCRRCGETCQRMMAANV